MNCTGSQTARKAEALHKTVLVVDDDRRIRETLEEALAWHGFSTQCAATSLGALRAFEEARPSAVLLDLKLPDMDGLEVLRRMRGLDHRVPVIIVTGHADIQSAVKATQGGAFAFLPKPFEVARLVRVLTEAVGPAQTNPETQLGPGRLMCSVMKQVELVAATGLSVVLEGQTGTGKSHVARMIHELSKRASGPFVKVDLGAMPETLVESELFGYEKGAFTGADRQRVGYLASARGGTVFIDELENLTPFAQSRILSVVEERKVYPLGGTRAVDVDIRIISATNGDIRKSVLEGKLRSDLFFRLGEFIITLPSLKERGGLDIEHLAERFLRETSEEFRQPPPVLSHGALEALRSHHWPGNVRELRNVVRRAVIMSGGGELGAESIGFLFQKQEPGASTPASLAEGKAAGPVQSLKSTLLEAEQKAIRRTLAHFQGDKASTATCLGITLRSLYMKIKKHHIDKAN